MMIKVILALKIVDLDDYSLTYIFERSKIKREKDITQQQI